MPINTTIIIGKGIKNSNANKPGIKYAIKAINTNSPRIYHKILQIKLKGRKERKAP